MFRRILILSSLCLCTAVAFGQDLSNIQIHGYVTQGFLYSSNNNLFTMTTSRGSARWTEGAVSVSDSLSDKLRVGIQFHVYQLGELGGPNLQIDWATGDYRASDKVRFVVGKVKTVNGLFNDSQDVDTVHLWVLLPESVYPTDNRSFTLSHYGGDFYGGMNLGKHRGVLSYRGYAGYRALDLNGGYAKQIGDQTGIAFTTGGSNVFGGDLRWAAPLKGLAVGMSIITTGLDGTSPQGSFHVPYATTPQPYAKFERGKFMVAGEYKRNTSEFNITFNLGGGATFTIPSVFDVRGWYAMSSYRISEKLQVGSYYSHYVSTTVSSSLPARFSNDCVVSGRYDFNPYFYAKLEGHFIDGTALDYYTSTNATGLRPKSNLLAAKVGFSF